MYGELIDKVRERETFESPILIMLPGGRLSLIGSYLQHTLGNADGVAMVASQLSAHLQIHIEMWSECLSDLNKKGLVYAVLKCKP